MTYNFDPQYITVEENKRPRDIVDNRDWNESFNMVYSQGNNSAEALDALINTGIIGVQLARHADNSTLLNGRAWTYYAARQNVLGIDEGAIDPGANYIPTHPAQPTNKKYVDAIFDEYTVKYASGVTLTGIYTNYPAFIAEHPTGTKGQAFLVAGEVVVWDSKTNAWYNAGPLQGPPGAPGASGGDGEDGRPGTGIPTGGAVGQYLVKNSASDFDAKWESLDLSNRVQSTTTKNITVSATAPAAPVNGDIWIKI